MLHDRAIYAKASSEASVRADFGPGIVGLGVKSGNYFFGANEDLPRAALMLGPPDRFEVGWFRSCCRGYDMDQLKSAQGHRAVSRPGKTCAQVSVVLMNDLDFDLERRWLSERAEPFTYLGKNFTGQRNVLDDFAARWLYSIAPL